MHGFSTRAGGVSILDGHRVLNLSLMEWDSRENVLQNRRLLRSAVRAKEFELLAIKQIHSDVIHTFRAMPAEPSKGDASATVASAPEGNCGILCSEDHQHGRAFGSLKVQNPFAGI